MFGKKKLSPAEFLDELRTRREQNESSDETAEETSATQEHANGATNGSTNSAVTMDAPSTATVEEDVESDIGAVDEAAAGDLSELFNRVNRLLGDEFEADKDYRPRIPSTLSETRLSFEEIERLLLKFLLAKGSATGRELCQQIKLPFQIVDPILKQLKQDQLVMFKGAAAMGDYDYKITDMGRERARRYSDECSYIGPAPVSMKDYLKAMAIQSIATQEATEEDLRNAFEDLVITDPMINRLGPAINSGRGMFLFGCREMVRRVLQNELRPALVRRFGFLAYWELTAISSNCLIPVFTKRSSNPMMVACLTSQESISVGLRSLARQSLLVVNCEWKNWK